MHGDWKSAWLMVDLPFDKTFVSNVIRRYIKSVADCKDVCTLNTRELEKSNEVYKFLRRGGTKRNDGCGTLFMKNVTKLLQRLIELCENNFAMFSLGRRNTLSNATFPIMITDNIQTYYKDVNKKVEGSRGGNNVWIENFYGTVELFVGFVDFIFDKTAATLKSTTLIAVPVMPFLKNDCYI